MSNLCLKKISACVLLPLILNGCAPLVPDNYLTPGTVQTSQKINGKWLQPRLIPITAKMLTTPEGRELLEPAMRPQPYQVGAFDLLTVIVWGHPEISTIYTSPSALPDVNSTQALTLNLQSSNTPILVQSDGSIFFPYVGHLKVAGLTINQIQNQITQRLSRYIRQPQITVEVAKFRNRNAYVLGEVRSPGMQPMTDKPLTLMEAISAAGGINTSTADPTHIYLVRGSYQKPDVFWLNAHSPQALLMAEQFPLQENDIVYVSAASLNAWNSFINQILPNFSTYYTIKGLS
jgi:polysaccharide export outer membrane protein